MSDEIETIDKNPKSWAAWKREAERLQEIIDGMALAAMNSEPVELPLDYLQGHKDGLEWAAQLAKANHPETGDWLYDDPIELAKAIRKGPDMPPEQPVEDSEPDRNPVLAYADSYRDMAKQGVESVPIWSVITDLERNIAPLYRHAQPAPVVGSEPEAWLWSRGGDDERDVSLTPPDDDDDAADAIECGWTATPLYRHAQQPVVPEEKPMPNTLSMYAVDAVAAIAEVKGWNACRAAMLNHPSSIQPNTDAAPGAEIKHPSSNSPVIPDGSTAGMFNSARALLDALYEFGPDEIAISEHVTNLEDALQNAAAPQSLGSEPATVPGKWIPVSERMPENDVSVLTFDGMYKRVHHAMYGHWQCWEPEKITHWMPLPAAPQEVKSES